MSEYLFTYGTLQPGLAPLDIAPAVNMLRPVGDGVVYGLLYDLGDYPGAILDPLSKQQIHGTIFQLPENIDILPPLDGYEDFDANSPATSLFLRELHSAVLTGGETLPCWIYVYNGKPDPARILPGGRFRRRSHP